MEREVQKRTFLSDHMPKTKQELHSQHGQTREPGRDPEKLF